MDTDKVKTEEITYISMMTTTRINYRSDCNFKAGSIVGVLDDNIKIQVQKNFKCIAYGHIWYKVKINRKHYFIVADYLKPIN
ncbi:hypothetical protein [Ruminococcus sp. Marseille-P6503]|uniref:hypothetical protein n=1 Tax=Ruminococcus sp. Marseille-P6503 TaxID=2364796 RepID=UPI000F53421C|nr:hypothetical protein [Ruminococcus sp. Marseille-P6503]